MNRKVRNLLASLRIWVLQGEPRFISVRLHRSVKLVQIELEKILYIEGLRDYVKIYLQDEPQPLVSLMSMKTLEELLPPGFSQQSRNHAIASPAFP